MRGKPSFKTQPVTAQRGQILSDGLGRLYVCMSAGASHAVIRQLVSGVMSPSELVMELNRLKHTGLKLTLEGIA